MSTDDTLAWIDPATLTEEHDAVVLALDKQSAEELGLTLEEYYSATSEQIGQLQESKSGRGPIMLTEEEMALI